MRMTDLPRLTIEAVEDRRCHAAFEPSSMIGERWIGCLHADDRFVWGRFVDVDAERRRCAFLLDDPTVTLVTGTSYPYFDGYWGERAELVLDARRSWEPRRFAPQDAVEFRTDSGRVLQSTSKPNAERLYRRESSEGASEGARVVPGGWDHEHCAVCWETIGTATSEAFFSEPSEWVCAACYARFIVPRSLDFINPEALERGPS